MPIFVDHVNMSEQFLITQAEFAKLMGVSKQAVSKAVKENRLTLIMDHKDGKMKINKDLASMQWRNNTMPRVENAKITAAPRLISSQDGLPEDENGDDLTSPDLMKEKAKTEQYRAKLLELDFREKTGELISTELAKKEGFKAARLVRDAILNVPGQICTELAVETDPFVVNQKLTVALTRALESLVIEIKTNYPQMMAVSDSTEEALPEVADD